MAASSLSPTRAEERIEFIDILRGLALLAILVENMSSWSGQPHALRAVSGPVEKVAVVAILLALQAKSYSLLSFLFGWGVAVQMQRVGSRGGRFGPFYLRRTLGLLALGVIHGTLIWSGDVLTLYALLGLLLLFFRKRSGRTVLAAAVGLMAFTVILNVPGKAMDAFRAWYDGWANLLRPALYSTDLYARGSYAAITRLRAQEYVAWNARFLYYVGPILSMFLLGFYVGRRRMLIEIDRHLPLVRKTLWIALGVGLVSNAIYVFCSAQGPSAYQRLGLVASRTLGAPTLVLFYLCAAALLAPREAWRQRLACFAQVGRTSLSNYLLQSVLCTLVFYGYGLGLYGKVGVIPGLMVALVVYWLQVRASDWWLDRYSLGPLEWAWRVLTYGKLRLQDAGEPGAHVVPLWRARLHELVSKVDRRAAGGTILVVLLAIGGWLYWRSQPEHIQAALVTGQVPSSTATPVPAVQRAAERTVVATPKVEGVSRHPGTIAASGDLLALASLFDAGSALGQIEVLTGPPYYGRYPGSSGGWAAGEYIAEQFARYGLQPAGIEGTFFQPFPIDYVALQAVPQLLVRGPDGRAQGDYVLHRDYTPVLRWYSGAGAADGEVVWANDCAHQDFDTINVAGKVVLCRDVSAEAAQRNALEHGADGLLLLADPQQHPPDLGAAHLESLVPEPIPTFRVFPSVVEALLVGSGRSVSDLSISLVPFPLLTSVQMQVATIGAEACPASSCQGRNVLGVLPGRDPRYADQVIIVGAHYDHLGQAPDGTAWVGANDDASGVAVLLEIARDWYEQGYVPQRTVLFAAWDAEEQGLVGSRHYVEHPQYPLENTVAELQLDMVGAGGDTLWVDGAGELGASIRAIAESLQAKAEATNYGRSDHAPFLDAGVPASLLIWSYGDEAVPEYHCPADTAEAIALDKLEKAGQIAGLTVLALTEGEPSITDLLAARAAAVEQGDLAAFLGTCLPEYEAAERSWFADAQALSPVRFEMEASSVRVVGRTATAAVYMNLEYADGDGAELREEGARLDVRFVHTDEGWKWAGPSLEWTDREQGFAVAYPPGKEDDVDGLAGRAADRYAEVAGLLGLPAQTEATIIVFSSAESLRASTGFSLPEEEAAAVCFRVAKLVYHNDLADTAQWDGALVQLLLAEAGIDGSSAAWLWQGLPLVLWTYAHPLESPYLGMLYEAMDSEAPLPDEAAAWAAVEYLRQQVGWEGIGRLIAALGQSCQEAEACSHSGEEVDRALYDVLPARSAGFEEVWPGYWRERLAAIQSGLDAVLSVRTEAVLAGDEAAFASAVDASVPHLLAEEQHWFADLTRRPVERFDLDGQPVALLEDGSVLAAVRLQYRLAGATGRWDDATVPLTVRFTPSNEGYRWAGTPLDLLQRGRLSVLYPAGYRPLAETMLAEAGAIYDQLAGELGVDQRKDLILKLYGSDQAFRTSIMLPFPLLDWVPAWTHQGESIKIRVRKGDATDVYRPILARQIARHLLYEAGVESEWFIKGVVTRLTTEYDGGLAERSAEGSLVDLLAASTKGTLPALEDMPPDYELSAGEFRIAMTQAWDTTQYLLNSANASSSDDNQLLRALVKQQGQGIGLDAALRGTIGQGVRDLEAAHAASLSMAHAAPEWIAIARDFDPGTAVEHIDTLAGPELAGRQAGSPMEQAAARYIASRFQEYGLVPAVPLAATGSEASAADFLQSVPISYTAWLSAPRFEILDQAGRVVESFVYRQDFVTDLHVPLITSTVVSELVLVRSPDYEGLQLGGKIAIRTDYGELDAEAAQAASHGAAGLIVVSKTGSTRAFLSKQPMPVALSRSGGIAVVELSQAGYDRLLESTSLATRGDIPSSAPAIPLGLNARLEIPLRQPEAAETVNVLGLLPGSDPALREEVVIVGAHYDHVGDDPDVVPDPVACSTVTATGDSQEGCERSAGMRYPGSNDNASGIGVMLEIARLWHDAGYHPRRSVLFAAWGAQEPGEIGSRYYVERPVFPLAKTTAVLELDAVGGGEGYYLEARGEREREGLLQFSMLVAADQVEGRVTMERASEQGDQVPFREAGVPALLVTWRGASEENWPVDMADLVQPYRIAVTGRVVALTLMTLAR